MSSQALWQRYCEYHRYYPEVGISIDISRMRFQSAFLEQMKPRIETAMKAMDALEKGEIANPDEGRMVGHYWLRSPDLSPSADLKSEILNANKKIADFSAGIHSGAIKAERGASFSHVVVVGIGGSALGPQLVADALGSASDKLQVLFCDNTDPDGIARIIRQLGEKLATTLVIVISKSGGTVETRNGALEFAAAFQKHGFSFARHAVAVTCEGSKLDKQAESEGWLERIYIWDWVGGRTSLFSAVGLLPAALQGIDIEKFLRGAKLMDAITRKQDFLQNPAALLSLMWYFSGDGKGKKDMVVLPYKDRLVLFSKYLQQLVMESLGKEKDLSGKVVNQGIAVYGNKGSTDQHAYVQQLRDGLNNFFVTFIQVLRDSCEGPFEKQLEVEPGVTSGDYLSGFLLGTRRALYENDRDSIFLTIDELSPESLGALIALYDRTVGFYASLVGINAYHQPGVEAGKKAAGRVIELQNKLVAELKKNSGARTVAELANAIGAGEEAETLYQILEHLSANNRVQRTGERSPEQSRFGVA